MVLFIMLYKVVLTFKYVKETLVWDHLNESYWAVLSYGTFYYAIWGGSNLWMKPQRVSIEQYNHVVQLIMLYKVVLTLKPVSETLMCDHSNVKLLSSTFPSCLLCVIMWF